MAATTKTTDDVEKTTQADSEDESKQAAPKGPPAESKPAKQKPAKMQGKGGIFWIVNPAGAVHSVTKEHAAVRLKTSLGWRKATEAEIKKAIEAPLQRFDDPICKPWSPDIDLETELG